MKSTVRKNTAVCVSCDQEIVVGDRPRLGQIIECSFCDTEQEIVGINPVILDWPFYDDDDDYYDDDYDDD